MLAAVAVALAIAAGVAVASHAGPRQHSGAAFRASALLQDGGTRVSGRGVARVSWHGGAVTLRSGEHLTVFVSDAYTEDVDSVQQWGEFFGGLIHGDELAQLTAYIATPDEVAAMCESTDALGCYANDRLVVTGETVEGIASQEIARHEYGHHVAAHRANPPWQSLDWGPKRWASAEQICGRERAGQVFPGDEGQNYTLNPGEAFAESYRVLNDVRSLGLAVDWRLADGSFLPTPVVLQSVADDVMHPWTAPPRLLFRARLGAGRRTWSTRLATPLDGSLQVTLGYPRGTRDDLVLMDGKRVVARGAPSGATSVELSALVCGQRSLTLRVTSRVGTGAFSLRVERP
jgi:hypothetical protein